MRTRPPKLLTSVLLAGIAAALIAARHAAADDPLEIARILAARYPSQKAMSYIPALAWSAHAWGRGNGFALLGLTETLTHLPSTWQGRSEVLDIYRRHLAALVKHQTDDGSWRPGG